MEQRPTRIVLAGGGTGGHLYPALAVAEELRRRQPETSIVFVGTRRGLEARLVPQSGFPLRTLPLAGLKGASLVGKLRAVAAALWSLARCGLWMLRERPNLVIGVGGYASGPAVLAARILKISTMIMEQNHYPGATNRWLAPRVDAVCLPSEAARARIGGRAFVTGNPVRAAFFEIEEPVADRPTGLLIFGGSRGARSINRAACAALDRLLDVCPELRIVHQSGEADEAEVRAAYAGCGARHEVLPFLDDMPARFAAADVVVCRAGASTISELCAAGRPGILVPYPHAADDHQRHNAETLADAGAAIVIADGQLDGTALADAVAPLVRDAERRRRMGRAARALGRPHAARQIADIAGCLVAGRPPEVRDVP